MGGGCAWVALTGCLTWSGWIWDAGAVVVRQGTSAHKYWMEVWWSREELAAGAIRPTACTTRERRTCSQEPARALCMWVVLLLVLRVSLDMPHPLRPDPRPTGPSARGLARGRTNSGIITHKRKFVATNSPRLFQQAPLPLAKTFDMP